ncbi:Spy/CpxP family protein refolding chaperone [Aestuariibius insulae]|uniref:Spy/CpxP family protein refolding chaperone n=1 Tax=Aestuariibius insulae TaxID=2058287 RepID=UPI00398F4C48
MRTPLAILLLATPVMAEDVSKHSPYAGEQAREIATLSADDLAELAEGGGWGLARAAELNGVPGPAHLLELADEIGLDAGQRTAVETIRDKMRADAIAAGERFVAAERALDAAFTGSVPDAAALERLVRDAGVARAELRLVHLSAHLRTTPLLTDEQVERYGVLRGYADDPCDAVPEGHDPEMWRRHNGCG